MIINFSTPKGGAGKTTALLTVANGMLLSSPDSRIAIIDTDSTVGSLRAFWRRRSEGVLGSVHSHRVRMWSIDPGAGEQIGSATLEQALNWADSVLIDSQGSMSPFNNMVASLSEITVIPTRLGITDFEPAALYLNSHRMTARQEGRAFSGYLLFTFAPVPQLRSEWEKKLLGMIDALPIKDDVLRTQIQFRSIYKDAQEPGLFLCEMAPRRGSNSLANATEESMQLVAELQQIASSRARRAV